MPFTNGAHFLVALSSVQIANRLLYVKRQLSFHKESHMTNKISILRMISSLALALGLNGCLITENGTSVAVSEDSTSSIQQASSTIPASSEVTIGNSETVFSSVAVPQSSAVDASSMVVMSSAVSTSSTVLISSSSFSAVRLVAGIQGIVVNEAGAPLSGIAVQIYGNQTEGCTDGGLVKIEPAKDVSTSVPVPCEMAWTVIDSTDLQGKFSIEGVFSLIDGLYNVTFVSTAQYLAGSATVEVKNGKSESLTQVLKKAPILTSCSSDLGCGSNEYCQARYNSQGFLGVCQTRYDGLCYNDLECGEGYQCAIYDYASPAVTGMPAILPPPTIKANGKCSPIQSSTCLNSRQCSKSEYCEWGSLSTQSYGYCVLGVQSLQMCPMNYAPVCGKDQIEYSNDCVARAFGTQVANEGPCLIQILAQ
jgi:hypothetical protein